MLIVNISVVYYIYYYYYIYSIFDMYISHSILYFPRGLFCLLSVCILLVYIRLDTIFIIYSIWNTIISIFTLPRQVLPYTALLLRLYGIQYILSNCVEIVHRHFTPPLYMPRKRLLFSLSYTSLYNLDKTYYLIVTRQYTRFVYVGQYSNIILHVYSKYKQ